MKNLIIYSSTYGFAEECAGELSKKLRGTTELVDVKKTAGVDLKRYDNIIMGGSIYMGQLNKALKEFMKSNLSVLKTKRTGFFVCCGFPEQMQKYAESNIPKELLSQAVSVECFGGRMDVSGMNFMHRLITKMVTKASEKDGVQKPVAPLPANINKMAQAINAP